MQPRKGSIPRGRRAAPGRAAPGRRPAGAAAPFSTAESSGARCRRGRPVRPGAAAGLGGPRQRGSVRLGSAGRRPRRAPAPPAAALGSPAPVPPPARGRLGPRPARPRRPPQFPPGGSGSPRPEPPPDRSPPLEGADGARPPETPGGCMAAVTSHRQGFTQPLRVTGL